MAKKSSGGLLPVLLVGGGLIAAAFYLKDKIGGLSIPKIPSLKLPTNSNDIEQKATAISYDSSKDITPSIIKQIQSVFNLEGSDVSNIIHGGTIQTGYLGSNGKYYADACDAWRSGAVAGYDPHNPDKTKPSDC